MDAKGPPRVVLINGPAGVGKTTTARLLAASVPNGACIHGDDLRRFIVRTTPSVEGRLTYRNGGAVAANFVRAGYDLVVFEYIFHHPDTLATFAAAYDADAPVHLFTLWAPLHVVQAREHARPRRDRLGGRVVDCYLELEANLSRLGQIVDTTRGTPDVVSQWILATCMGRGGEIPMWHSSVVAQAS